MTQARQISVTIEQLDAILDSKSIDFNELICLNGKMGMGELLSFKKSCTTKKFKTVILDSSFLTSEDFTPKSGYKGDEFVLNKPPIIEMAEYCVENSDNGCVLFFDEGQNMSSYIEDFFERLVTNRSLAGYPLPKNTLIVLRKTDTVTEGE